MKELSSLTELGRKKKILIPAQVLQLVTLSSLLCPKGWKQQVPHLWGGQGTAGCSSPPFPWLPSSHQ